MTKIVPTEGYLLTETDETLDILDRGCYTAVILGKGQSADEFKEITKDEAQSIIDLQKEAICQQLKAEVLGTTEEETEDDTEEGA